MLIKYLFKVLKKYQMKDLLIFFLVTAYAVSSYAQSGFTREKKNFYLKADYQFYNSVVYRNNVGTAVKTNEFSQKTFSLYGEYGISDKFAINANIPVFRINGYENTNAVGGFGDVSFELKYALKKGKFPIALSIAPSLPTGTKKLFAKSKENSFDKIDLPTSDGEFNVWTTAAISHSFYPKPMYASAFTSFNFRTKYKERNFQDQFQAGVEFGYKFIDKLWLSGKLLVLTGVGPQPAIADFIRGDGASYTGVSINSQYELGKHLGLNAQYFRCNSLIVRAKNIYAAGTFSFGVVYVKKR